VSENQLLFVAYFSDPIVRLTFFALYSCLAHVVNLANVDIMSYITKIAAVKTSTAIWEYDPGNCVLGGSLDVIAANQMLAIKVWFQSLLLMLLSCHPTSLLRFKPLVNILRYSTSYKSKAESQNPSRYLCTAMYDGVQHSLCLTGSTNFVKSCSSIFLQYYCLLIYTASLSISSSPLLTSGMALSPQFAMMATS
jgi:hypothetical protein